MSQSGSTKSLGTCTEIVTILRRIERNSTNLVGLQKADTDTSYSGLVEAGRLRKVNIRLSKRLEELVHAQ